MLNVSDAFDADTCSTVTHEREQAGGYVDGYLVEGSIVTTTILASIQPVSLLSKPEFQDLPEGLRNEVSAVIWTQYPLLPDDKVVEDGVRYRVLPTDNWQKRGGYTHAMLGAMRP